MPAPDEDELPALPIGIILAVGALLGVFLAASIVVLVGWVVAR